MPTYAYRCPEGHEFDRVQKINAPPGATCPQCGQAAQRVITGGAGLVFKGSGFYITDYKRAGKKPSEAKGAETTESRASETGGGKASDSTTGDQGKTTPKKRDAGSRDS